MLDRKLRIASILVLLVFISLACDMSSLPFGSSDSTSPGSDVTPTLAAVKPTAGQSGSGRTPTANPSGAPQAIPVNVTELPAGMKVVEQGAVWDPAKEWIYTGFVIESATYSSPLKVNYQLWRSGDTSKPTGSGANWVMGQLFPPKQYGGGMMSAIQHQQQPALRLDFQFMLQPLSEQEQKNGARVSDAGLPAPFFTAAAAELSAQKDAASGRFKVQAKVKVTNNLPVQAEATGLFFFYDSAGKVVAFTPSACDASSGSCGFDKADKIETKATKELVGELPYLLAAQPASVKFFPMANGNIYATLSKIK